MYGALFESPPDNIYHLDRFSVLCKHDWLAGQFSRVMKSSTKKPEMLTIHCCSSGMCIFDFFFSFQMVSSPASVPVSL